MLCAQISQGDQGSQVGLARSRAGHGLLLLTATNEAEAPRPGAPWPGRALRLAAEGPLCGAASLAHSRHRPWVGAEAPRCQHTGGRKQGRGPQALGGRHRSPPEKGMAGDPGQRTRGRWRTWTKSHPKHLWSTSPPSSSFSRKSRAEMTRFIQRQKPSRCLPQGQLTLLPPGGPPEAGRVSLAGAPTAPDACPRASGTM